MFRVIIQFQSGSQRIVETEVQPGFSEKSNAVMIRIVIKGQELGIIYANLTHIRSIEYVIYDPDNNDSSEKSTRKRR